MGCDVVKLGSSRRSLIIAAVTVCSIATTLLAPASAMPQQAAGRRPGLPLAHQVKVRAVGRHAPNAQTVDGRRASANALALQQRRVVWPTAGSLTVTRKGQAPASGPVRVIADAGPMLRARVVAQSTLARAGIAGVGVLLSPSASGTSARMAVNYSGFGTAFGADWPGRLQVVAYPSCLLTTPKVAKCQQGRPVRTIKDPRMSTLTAFVPRMSSRPMVLAAAAAGTSTAGNGDFTATSLSASSSWTAGGSSGDFDWSYPLRTPPANGGPAPNLKLTYSSQSVDGRTASTNNQTSSVGEGFDLASNYIEREYATCKDDGVSGKYDLCWKTDNATLMLNGQANQLFKAADGTWRLRNDDGSRIRRLTSTSSYNLDNDKEYWELTAADGTKYIFGRTTIPGQTGDTQSVWYAPVAGNDAGEPCHGATFAASFCNQAWRWNLDYVVDPSGNAMSYWYSAETNNYAKNGVASPAAKYVRGGYLTRIDYGLRDAGTNTNPPMRVTLTDAVRCFTTSCSTYSKSNWPDTPYDQICADGATCTGKLAPTFFSRYRLTSVTTSIRKSAAYESVDSWTFAQHFINSGDVSDASLWLDSITRTGLVGGSIALPAVTFAPVQLTNRVDTTTDGLSPLPRFRIRTITSETGSVTTVNYSNPECTPTNKPAAVDNNVMRCFPQKWTPPGNTSPLTDWFHKYVVTDVTNSEPTALGTPVTTYYTYSGGGAWAYNQDKLTPDSYRSWSIWRGYGKVTTTVGDPALTSVRSQTTDTYFRGMDGDKQISGTPRSVAITDSTGASYADSRELAGFRLESVTYDGAGGAEFSGDITKPWTQLTAGSGDQSAHFVEVGEEDSRTALSTGGSRYRNVSTTHDPNTGQPTRVSDTGATNASGDEECTATQYADTQTAAGAWFVGFPSRVVTSAGLCGSDALTPAEGKVLADVRTRYDNLGQDVAPTKGLVTQADRLSAYSAGLPQYQVTSTVGYDANGRVISVVAPVNGSTTRTTTTAYTMSSDGTLTSTTVTQDSGGKAFATTTTQAPEWGQATVVSDPNAHLTQAAYDPLGRVVSVWLPNRGATATPNTKYAYTISNSAPPAVTTSSLNRDGSAYNSSVQIFDSLLRPRETQTPSPAGGRIVSATMYDARGLVSERADEVYASGAPSTTLVQFSEGTVPKLVKTTYDGLGRDINDTLYTSNAARWSTVTSYAGGDSTTVTPPQGAPPTTTITDVRGQVVKRTEHGTPDTTTTYAYDLRGEPTQLVGAAGTWTNSYDLRGRKTSSTDPDAGTSTYTYTDDDQVATTTDSRGQSTLTTYDALDRKTALYAGTSVDPANQLAAWAYDTVAKGQAYTSTRYVGGQAGDAFTSKVTGYDLLYHVSSSSFTIVPGVGSSLTTGLPTSLTRTTTYNIDGTLAADYLPKVSAGGQTPLTSEALGYSYNSLGMPTALQGRTAIIQDTVYDNLGRAQQYTLGQGSAAQLYLTNTYDDGTDRLTRQLATTNLSSNVVSDHHYTYDNAGNTTKDAETAGGDTQCFGYDDHDRLATAWTPGNGDCTQSPAAGLLGGPAPYWQSWSYTNAGLRSSQTTATPGSSVSDTYTYPAAGSPHQNYATSIARNTTSSSGSTSTQLAYGVDAAGNTTARPDPAASGGTDTTSGAGEQALTWDTEGDLASLTRPGSGGTTRYVYGVDGTLLLEDSPTTKILYAGETEVRLDKTSGTLSARRNYSPAAGLVATRSSDTQIDYLVPDPHGTAGVALDGPTLTPKYRYTTPFGETRGGSPTSWPNTRGFLGADVDAAAGLSSVGQRQYDAATGRFISADPLLDTTNSAQMLGYDYSNNNPVRLTDPTGMAAKCVKEGTCSSTANPHGGPPTPTGVSPVEEEAQQRERDYQSLHKRALAFLDQQNQIGTPEWNLQFQETLANQAAWWATQPHPGVSPWDILGGDPRTRVLNSAIGIMAIVDVAQFGANPFTDGIEGALLAERASSEGETSASIGSPTRAGGVPGSAESGQVTVLGRYTGGVDAYVGKPGFNTLDLPFKGTGRWYWSRNKAFIDDAIERGDEIRLVTDPYKPLYQGGNVYQRELRYLRDRGYTFEQNDDYWIAVRGR